MAWSFSVYQIPPFVAALISLGVMTVAWRHRSKPIGRTFLVLMVGIFEWSLAYAVQLGFASLSNQLLFDKAAFVGALVVPTAWVVLTVQYADYDDVLSKRALGALAIEPVLTLVLVWTNGAHGLVYREWTLTRIAGTPVLVTEFGPWYWLNLGYSYLLVAAGLALLVDVFLRGSRIYRKQAGALVFGAVFPLAANVLSTTGSGPLPGVDLTTFTFSLTGVFVGVSLFEFDLLDHGPVARRRMSEVLDDGFVAADERGQVVDYNEVAERVLGDRIEIGRPVHEAFESDGADTLDGSELSVTVDGDPRIYHVRCSPLESRQRASTGTLVVMHDVTSRKAYEQRLEVTNRLLRHNLRNDATVIMGHADDLADRLSGRDAEQARLVSETAERLGELSRKAKRIEASLQGVGTTEPVAVDVADVVDEVVERFRTEHPDAEVRTDVPASVRVSVVEEDLLEVAVSNLVENAIEHADERPRVEVTVTPDDPTSVAVADNGPGIPEMERSVLASGEETPLRHGSGLGLWLVHWIVSASGGSVSFDENGSKGSVVTLELPAA